MVKEIHTAELERMIVANNLNKLLDETNKTKTDVARELNLSETTVYSWFNGKKYPRIDKIQMLADYFGVLKSDITEDKESLLPQLTIKGTSKEVPLYGSISAGLPIEMIAVDDYIEVPSNIANTYPNAFLLEVKGDSMNKLLPTGTYALIEPCQEVENGTVAAVAINGYEATLKRFHKLSNGIVLEPESYNPEHSTQLYDCNEIDCGDIKILGKLVWHMAPTHIKY